jgi:DNA mismatch repair ATPase MutS
MPFRLYTCIRISDSLDDGFSYFYAEVKRLKGLLEAIQPGPSGLPLLYLVDEIFRGTNNRERLIGSRAYVKALIGAAGVGLIATHDLDLATLAENHPQVCNVHFRDEVAGGKLTFDYLLRPGPSPTTNALKIMQIEGLPVED